MNKMELLDQAMAEAKATIFALGQHANIMVDALLVDGVLRRVRPHYLRRLKRKLAQFDSKKLEWKD